MRHLFASIMVLRPRRMLKQWSVTVAFLVIVVALVLALRRATNAALTRDETLLSQSKYLADAALQLVGTDKAVVGLLLALEALPDANSAGAGRARRPYWPKAEFALDALRRATRERTQLSDCLTGQAFCHGF
jgi:hypothetical protein